MVTRKKPTPWHKRQSGRWARPKDREELAIWVENYCGLHLPRAAVCPEHRSPLDYLAWAFFEGRPAAPAPGAVGPVTGTPNPAEGGEAEGGGGGGGGGDCVVWACRGGGKTQLGAVATLLDMLFKPGVQIRILGGSREQSEKMYDYLRTLVEDRFPMVLRGKPTRRGMRFGNGSRVEILAQSEKSVRGQRVQKLRCDEVELFAPAVWEAAQLTTRSTADPEGPPGAEKLVRGSVEAVSTMHIPGGLMQNLVSQAPARGRPVFCWCLWDVIAPCPPTRACGTCALSARCRGRARRADGFVPLADAEAMLQRVSAETWAQEMECARPVQPLAVFRGFAAARHVRAFRTDPAAVYDTQSGREERVPVEWVCGMDFGLRVFACIWLAVVRGPAPRVWVVDELRAEGQRLEQNIAAVLARMGRNGLPPRAVVHCDPAGAQRNAHSGKSDVALLREAGLEVRYQPQAIDGGLRLLAELIDPACGAPRLAVHPRCKAVAAALEQYRYAGPGREALKDGVHDHAVDALRYGVCGVLGTGRPGGWRMY